jgi:hypothetical protein
MARGGCRQRRVGAGGGKERGELQASMEREAPQGGRAGRIREVQTRKQAAGGGSSQGRPYIVCEWGGCRAAQAMQHELQVSVPSGGIRNQARLLVAVSGYMQACGTPVHTSKA